MTVFTCQHSGLFVAQKDELIFRGSLVAEIIILLVEGLEPEYREWLIDFGSDSYVALYRLDGQKAVILAVRHQKEAGE